MARWLHLVRHGVGAGAAAGMFLGKTDPPLSPVGEAQARALAGPLAGLAPTRAFTSPLARGRRTAALALPALAAAVLPDLREIDFGRWEGRTFAQIAAAEPDLVRQWNDFDPDFGFPGGERLRDFHARVQAVATVLAAEAADGVAVFTHGGVIRTLICHFLGLPLRQYLIFRIDPGSLSSVELFGDRGVLTGLNLIPAEAESHG